MKINNNLNLINYQEYLKDRNRSAQTIAIYCEVLKLFTQKHSVNTDGLRNFLKKNITKYQPNTLKVFRQALSSYAKFAKIIIDWDRITGIIPKSMRNFFNTLTVKELELLKQTRFERNKRTYQRNNLIFDFLFYSGLRVSELVNIRHSDWKDKSLRVHGKGNKFRQVFLPPFLISHFKDNSNDYLFTNQERQQLTPLVVRQIIQQRVKKAGIDKNITPHSFRRSFATWLHNNGAKLITIQQLLGHESITTTEKYIQADFDTLYQDYSKLWKSDEPGKIFIH